MFTGTVLLKSSKVYDADIVEVSDEAGGNLGTRIVNGC